jgi:hypothetical protein
MGLQTDLDPGTQLRNGLIKEVVLGVTIQN